MLKKKKKKKEELPQCVLNSYYVAAIKLPQRVVKITNRPRVLNSRLNALPIPALELQSLFHCAQDNKQES